MLLHTCFALLAAFPPALCSSLIDFSPARGDNPSILGILNLEAARDVRPSGNTDDLYAKLGTAPNGDASLHYHRIAGDIRAEYHSLSGKTKADTTYYIGYKFSLAEVENDLMIWQFKEYKANTADAGGANIPLSLEIKSGKLNLQYQSSYNTGRVSQWSVTPKTNTVYSVGLVINTATPGWVELYWNGVKQTFSTTGTTRLSATTYPGQAEPKFGAYRGEAVEIDTYVYRIQIGTTIDDITDAASLSTSTPACGWEGHCPGDSCASNDDCWDQLTCSNGVCADTTCTWTGHCDGDTCSVDEDCEDPYYCQNSVCALNY